MDFWPSDFLLAYETLDTGREMPIPTSLRDHPLRQKYMASIADLVQLSITCRRITVIAREALYSRVRIDNRRALVSLTASLSRQTNTMNLNSRFIQRLELDMDLEDGRRAFWRGLGFKKYSELDTFAAGDLAPYLGCRLGSLFSERVFSICPSLKYLAALDDVVDFPNHPPTGFRPEHMRACMVNLTNLDLHNTPFQFTTLGRALAEAKKLKSLSITIDIADPPKEWHHLISADDPNLNTLLPLCTDSLEHLNLILSWARHEQHTQQFLLGAAGKLTCLPRLSTHKTVRAKLRTIFGASRVVPRDFSELGLDYAERHDLIDAAGEAKLPTPLEKLDLVEEQDARVQWCMLSGADTDVDDIDRCENDLVVQWTT
ncbi:hypothetical protein C8A01DRAFT_35553 [Parachaetomium inaequale]|uniref:F-box domain-containing protein n=1 Tax=Parachaetomium inaequale TaxID=2588326 RepID=A0AAN6PI20_9PEZI|nr:hypothetical protein C8A01DRAFT_35553 [Parachaetomium inaequale]